MAALLLYLYLVLHVGLQVLRRDRRTVVAGRDRRLDESVGLTNVPAKIQRSKRSKDPKIQKIQKIQSSKRKTRTHLVCNSSHEACMYA